MPASLAIMPGDSSATVESQDIPDTLMSFLGAPEHVNCGAASCDSGGDILSEVQSAIPIATGRSAVFSSE